MSKHGVEPDPNMEDEAKRRDGEKKTPGEMDRDVEEVKKRSSEEFAKHSNPIVDNAIGDLDLAKQTITPSVKAAVEVDIRDSKYNENLKVDEDFESDNEPGGLHRAKATAADIKANEIGLVDRTLRFFARAKGITLFFGIATAIGIVGTFATSIAALVKSMNDGSPDPELNVTPEQRDNLKTLIKHWWELSDALLWDQLATFCDQFNPSLQAQVVLMDLIKELSKALDTPFVWKTDDDKWNAIQAIVNAYVQFTPTIGQSKSQALYKTIKDYKYLQGSTSVPLPRQIAADVVELALYQIIRIPKQPVAAQREA